MFRPTRRRRRRGAVIVLAAILMVVLVGMAAFAIDVGYITLTKAELQNAADAGAIAAAAVISGSQDSIRQEAQEFAGYHHAAGSNVAVANADVEFGLWNSTTRQFLLGNETANAVRVTARRQGANLFFAPVMGVDDFSMTASAIAMVSPRDIAFVVDLSGSMNDDSEPCWATQAINTGFAAEGYPTLGDEVAAQLYSDFGFGTFPGTLQHIGEPLGITQNTAAYQNLIRTGGPLTTVSIPTTYRIASGDSNSVRKTKSYRWMIDQQIAAVMPSALPTPSNTTYYSYWEKYLDYIIYAGSNTAPSSQSSIRIASMANPNTAGYSWADPNSVSPYQNKIGYRTYVQFMLDHGRDLRPDGVNYTPLSTRSPLCPKHWETTPGGSFEFPPREQPTHSSRRAVIGAVQVVKERNTSIPDVGQRDWVSIITFDATNDGGPKLLQSLTGDYTAAMTQSTTMQGVADAYYSTSTESGLQMARQHLLPASQGGVGRSFAKKVVVLLTDGAPNVASSSTSAINSYISANPSSNYYVPASYAHNGALMQTSEMQLKRWQVFAVGIGLGTDYNFMDRLGRMGNTANDEGQSPRGSGNPAEYEQRTVEIFENIIKSPKPQLVQ